MASTATAALIIILYHSNNDVDEIIRTNNEEGRITDGSHILLTHSMTIEHPSAVHGSTLEHPNVIKRKTSLSFGLPWFSRLTEVDGGDTRRHKLTNNKPTLIRNKPERFMMMTWDEVCEICAFQMKNRRDINRPVCLLRHGFGRCLLREVRG